MNNIEYHLKYIFMSLENENHEDINEYINRLVMDLGSLIKENLINIRLHHHRGCILVKSNVNFVINIKSKFGQQFFYNTIEKW